MKTITLNSATRLIRSQRLALSLALLSSVASFAQLQNNGTLFIKDKSIVTLKTGDYKFGSNATGVLTKTTRTDVLHGKLIFGALATSSGASISHFIDGYARTLSTSAFTLNVGQNNILAPTRVVAAATSLTGVDAAFYKQVPANNLNLGTDLANITNEGFWDIQGAAKISLSWRAATTSTLSTTDYTIVGYNTATSSWEIIPSVIDGESFLGFSSTPEEGSITSSDIANLSNYRLFTIGAKGDACQPLVGATGPIKTWTGVWSGDELPPTEINAVVIDALYNTLDHGSFTANSIVLNNDIVITDGKFVESVFAAEGDGKIILSSEANFVQRSDDAEAPLIELNKISRDKMRRYDYIYWGIPTEEQSISIFQTAKATPIGSPEGAFDLFYKYTSGQGSPTNPVSGWVPMAVGASSEIGRGFISRVKQQAPFTTSSTESAINVKFIGKANNGEVSVAIVNNPLLLNAGSSHNLLSNPYPSAIDADKFLIENSTSVDGVIYIWTSATSYPGIGYYSQGDYIAYTRLGSTQMSHPDVTINTNFTGKIASGQGFKVKSIVPTGFAKFNNCMRLTTDNNQFYKTSNTVVDRYKINMIGDNAVASVILVGYTPETTLDYDRMYDATINSVSTAQLYSFLDNTSTKLAINARPSFANTDKVAVGFTKNNTNTETFTFTIAEKEGVFNNGDALVYLHDKVQGTYHDFSNGSFTFTTNSTNVNNRFELVYQTSGDLSNPDFDTTNTFVSLNKNIFKVSTSGTISEIVIYDIAGRLISTYSKVNDQKFSSNFNRVQGVYIAKIKLVDGTIVTEKLINQ